MTHRPNGESRPLNDPAARRGLALMFGLFKNYRRDAGLSIASALVWMAVVVIVPYVEKIIIDRAISGGRRELLGPLVGLLLAVGFVKALGVGGRRWFAFRLSYRAETDLRNRIFEHVQRLAFTFHDRTATGELMARSSSDLSQVRLVFAMLPITIANIAMFVIIAVVLILLDPVLGSVTVLAIPAMGVIALMYARRVLAASFEVQQRLADMASVVEEGVSGIRVVKAFGREDLEVAKVDRVADRIYAKTMELVRERATFVPLFEVIPSLATVAVLWLGGLRVADGVMSLGDFVAFTQYLLIMVFPLRLTGWFFAELPRAAAAASRVVDLMAKAPDIDDPRSPTPLPDGGGEIRFEDVAFAYPDGPRVLDGFDLTIPAGASVAVVGSTGSGKSTLAYLVPRFYDPDAGRVLLDGVDVREIALDRLRGEVAVVFEDTFLFSSTIGENIGFGDPDASKEQIRLAARLAQAHGFICAFEDGYDTVVGERGLSLSGGQRQRVALARAILRDPRVLILDDATSSVDAATEAEIRSALETVMKGRTTLIIAHRTSTLKMADSVVVIEDGRVLAVGSHAELLETVPRYEEILSEAVEDTDEPVERART
ncbi:MAG TPA: ABC transporter ATP-binding protein [Acidimicrobiia bacterium]